MTIGTWQLLIEQASRSHRPPMIAEPSPKPKANTPRPPRAPAISPETLANRIIAVLASRSSGLLSCDVCAALPDQPPARVRSRLLQLECDLDPARRVVRSGQRGRYRYRLANGTIRLQS